MKLRVFSEFVCIGAMLGAASASLRADSIEYSYRPIGVSFLSDSSVVEGIQGFNSDLGTLTSIEIDYSATAVIQVGDALSTHLSLYDGSTLLDRIFFPDNMDGRDEQNESGSFDIPSAELADFETAGAVDLTLTPFTACRGTEPTPTGCEGFTANVADDVVYTYTPAPPPPPVPEPASFVLFGAGLVGVGLYRRRQV